MNYEEQLLSFSFTFFKENKAQMQLVMILSNVHAYSFILQCYKRLNISEKPKGYSSFTSAGHMGYEPLGKLLL